jgi:hypothetical protein
MIPWTLTDLARGAGPILVVLLLGAGCSPPARPAVRLVGMSAPGLAVSSAPAAGPRLTAGSARIVWVNRFSAPGTAPLLAVLSSQPLPPGLSAVSGRHVRPGEPGPGGPPHLVWFRLPAGALREDALRVEITSEGRPVAGLELAEPRLPAGRPLAGREVWPAARTWAPELEWLYSRFVAQLFDEDRFRNGWRPLHQVVRNPARNLLWGVMGLHEDGGGPTGSPRISLVGDCADVAYHVRAYFAWKLALPMRYRQCTRGDALRGPDCYRALDSLSPEFGHHADPVERFNDFVRRGIAWRIHSGAARTLPEDEASDLYPIRVGPDTLVPGTIYVDGGGHLLVVSRVTRTEIVAIDGHPDMSITMRRFADREFFRVHPGTRTGGFKAFRPLKVVGGAVVPLPNAALGDRFATEQYDHLRRHAFHGFIERRVLLAARTGP